MDSREVFGVYTNITECFEKDRNVSFNKPVFIGRLQKQKVWVKDICSRITNEINNGIYSIYF